MCFSLPIRENKKNTHTKKTTTFCHPRNPRTILQIHLCLCVFLSLNHGQQNCFQMNSHKAQFSERKRHINFFHINFLCRPSSPGLSQGQTGLVPGTNPVKSGFHCVKQGENPGFSQVFTGFVPGRNPMKSPGQTRGHPKTNRQKSLCLCAFFLPDNFASAMAN